MTRTNRKPAAVAITLAVAVLVARSNARAQSASEPLVSATSIQSIQQQLHALKAEVATLKTANGTLERQVGSLLNRLTAAHDVLALEPFVRVDPSPEVGVAGPNVTFSGANIHIVSGTGATDDGGTPQGLGNLIIGYDEVPTNLGSRERGGSHNLVIGRYHRFTSTAFGGIVAGEADTISNQAASVTGGSGNVARGPWCSVTGGQNNTANSYDSSVTGGFGNVATSDFSSISGGQNNTTHGFFASITGGTGNTASGQNSVVLGGQNVTTNNDNSIAPQPPFP